MNLADFRPVVGRHAGAMLLAALPLLFAASFVAAVTSLPWEAVSAGLLLWILWYLAFASAGGIPIYRY